MTEQDVAERSRLATYLGKEIWPATRDEVISAAESQHAPDEVIARFQQLPDQSFTNMAELWSALGGGNETVRT